MFQSQTQPAGLSSTAVTSLIMTFLVSKYQANFNECIFYVSDAACTF